MKIDIRSPDGNTMAALGIATKLLKAVGAEEQKISSLRLAVFDANNAAEARLAIAAATNGAIEFYDSNEEE